MYGNCFRSLHQVTLHQLKDGWDRRGRLATLTFERYKNQEYQQPLIINSVRALTSFLNPHYSATPLDEYDYDEINECWIKYDPWYQDHDGNYVTVDIHHKYWSNERIECFIDLLIALGKLYRASVVDERR